MSVVTEAPRELRSERLLLRQFRESDFEEFAAQYADPEACRFIGGLQSREDAWRRMASFIGHWQLRGYGFWALERLDNGAFIGACGLWCPEGWPEPEVGYWLRPAHQGQGFVSEAVLASRRCAYEQLGWTTLTSNIVAENRPSQAVAKRVGCVLEGTAIIRGTECGVWRHPPPA